MLNWSRAIVEPPLRQAVDTLPGRLRHLAGYHFGWWDEKGREGAAGPGKAIRPALAFLCAEASGGRAESAIPAAVAVELVHNFSLLHDDVMDGDRTRRHRPTAWSVFGVNNAILAGDALLALAARTLTTNGIPPVAAGWLSATVVELCEGQFADCEFEHRMEVGKAECLTMVRHKTGALLGCACALGALLGGGSEHQIATLREFGVVLGVAFQATDDILGIWGAPEVTGKPVYSDLRSGKKSLPVVAAMESATPAGAELKARYRAGGPLENGELASAAGLIESAGGRTWTERTIAGALEEAVGLLVAGQLTESGARRLRSVAHLLADRDH